MPGAPLKLAAWLLGGLAALAILAFVLANREPVAVSFSPLPWRSLEVWPGAVALAFFCAGALVGGLFVWAGGHESRKLSARRRRRIARLEKDLEDARTRDREMEEARRRESERSPATLPDARNAARPGGPA